MSGAQQAARSCADLTASLVVEGCLPMIMGEVAGQSPIAGLPVTPEERAKLNLDPAGLTVFYPAQDEGVFFDMMNTSFQLWFAGGDIDRATSALDSALKRAFPKLQQLDDVPHQKDKRLHARVYRVELPRGRLAAISTSFKDLKDGRRQFKVRIQAQARPA
ncbi:MAG: hypothetical protein ABL883_12810 [Terricaulis sp.]